MNIRTLVVSCGVACLLGGCTRQPPIQAKQESGPVPVKVAPVQTRKVQRVIESVGTLFPYDETIISAEIEGRVDRVNFDLGDLVTPGKALVHIADEEQRFLLAQNEAQLRSAQERLGLREEGDRVKDVRETSEVRRAQADLTDAEQRHKRTKSLVDQQIGSQSDLDQSMARLKATQAAYDQSISQTRNLIQEIERARAVVGLQRKKLRDATVFAPAAAYVKERQVTVGQYVRPNTPLMTLVKTDPVRLRIEVPERMAPWIKTGQVAEVLVEAFADQRFSGRIWRISPTVDQAKRTFMVEALIDNPSGRLKPGSYAKARIPTNKVDEVLLVPVRSVNYVFGSNKAYVVRTGVAEAREVKLGDRFDEQVEILEGIEGDEQVATTQLARLDTGVKVKIVPNEAGQTARAPVSP